jgi:hypothetical protein
MIYRIEEKCSALGQFGRHSLLLSKVGCPVGVREHLPVDGSVFDQLEEGDEIEIHIVKRNPATANLPRTVLDRG